MAKRANFSHNNGTRELPFAEMQGAFYLEQTNLTQTMHNISLATLVNAIVIVYN